MTTALLTIGIVAGSIWIGSLVCLALVSNASRRTLDSASRVALFRVVGRTYGIVGTSALAIAIAVGLTLAWPPSEMTGTLRIEFLLGALRLLATLAGMAQARSMTVKRQHLLAAPEDPRAKRTVRHGAQIAGVLRGTLALLTFGVVVLGAHLLDRLS
jgi:hypothetical protein